MDIFWLVLGLVLILVGANMLTDGASAIARRWGVSDIVVGLTVVAFGTSAPELTISILSAMQGSADMAIGNVVGSNIFNVFVIIGVVAMIHPIQVTRSIMTNEIPFVIVSSLALLAIGCGPQLGLPGIREIGRPDGILLLLFFAIFMRYTFSQAKNVDNREDPVASNASSRPLLPAWKATLWILGGLAGLVWGGDRFVDGASGVAKSLGMSEALIGLTIVAAGTSLPELATSCVSAIKGKTGIAIGNVIGSNIFNIFMVLGVTSTIMPLPFGGVTTQDLIVMTVATLMFWFFGWRFGNRCINRWEGAVLLICYLAYVTFQVLSI